MSVRRWNRVFPDMLIGDRNGRVPRERWFTGEHFVKNATQRIHVGAGVHGFAPSLFG